MDQALALSLSHFDRCISTPEMMPKVGKLGKVLSPRSLMPNPKLGSVTNDITKAVEGAKAGEIEYKNNDTLMQAGIAKSNFSKDELGLMKAIKKHCDPYGILNPSKMF